MTETQNGYVSNRILKIQVGFLLNEGPGQSRDYEFDVPSTLRVAEDLTLDYLFGSLHLSRTSRGILVQGTLDTRIDTECTRCLEKTAVEIKVPIEELFVNPPEPGEEWNLGEDGILDLVPLVREEIILDTPIGALCRPDCAGICPTCGKNLNDGPCGCEPDNIDPRFSALKKLKDDLLKE